MSSLNTEKLKAYLSDMTIQERRTFAKECKTSLGNLNQIIYVSKKCSADLAIRIDKASKGKVPCDDLCHADFEYVRNQAKTA